MESGVLTAVDINIFVFRDVLPYTLVPPAALKADSCPASHFRGRGSIPGESISDFWWKERYWVTFRCELFDCTLPIIIPPTLPIRSYYLVTDNVPISGRSSTEMRSHPTIRIKLRYAWLTVSYAKLNPYSTVNWFSLASHARTLIVCEVPRKGSLTKSHLGINEDNKWAKLAKHRSVRLTFEWCPLPYPSWGTRILRFFIHLCQTNQTRGPQNFMMWPAHALALIKFYYTYYFYCITTL